MKLNFGKKLVLFLHWLMSLVLGVLAFALCFFYDAAVSCLTAIDTLIMGWGDVAGIAAGAVYVLLSVLTVVFIFSGKKKRVDRSFITVDNSDAGRTRIAISAVEQMIRQSVRGVNGIVDMKSSITNNEDSISINSTVSIASGAHVPTVTMNIQRAVRSYIELNCGVAVREVCVSVSALESEENGKKRGRGHAAAPAAVESIESVQPPVIESPAETPVESTPAAEEEPEMVFPEEDAAAEEENENQASE